MIAHYVIRCTHTQNKYGTYKSDTEGKDILPCKRIMSRRDPQIEWHSKNDQRESSQEMGLYVDELRVQIEDARERILHRV